MRLILRIIVILMAVWLQTSYFGHFRPFGVLPNLVLIVVVLSALLSEATPTVATAVLGGLLLDLSSATDFGLRAATLSVVALAVITARQYGLHSDSFATIVGIVVAATLGADTLSFVSLGFSPVFHSFGLIAVRISIEMAENTIIAVAGYLLASSLVHRLPGRTQRAAL